MFHFLAKSKEQNPKSTLNEIFNQINTAELEEVRKRAIKFLVSKLPLYLQQTNEINPTKDLEESIVKHVKTVIIIYLVELLNKVNLI